MRVVLQPNHVAGKLTTKFSHIIDDIAFLDGNKRRFNGCMFSLVGLNTEQH